MGQICFSLYGPNHLDVKFTNCQWGEFKGKGLPLSEANNCNHKQAHEIATEDVRLNYNLKEANKKRIDLIKSL